MSDDLREDSGQTREARADGDEEGEREMYHAVVSRYDSRR
jgi:hypothetical protein